jgi:hypothetical protein
MAKAIPTPPTDQSGGFFVLQISDGVHTHRHRVHVNSFNNGLTTVSGFGTDYVYTAKPPSAATNFGVAQDAQAYANLIKVLYSAAWNINLMAIFYKAAPGVFQELPLPSGFAQVTGTNATATTAGGYQNQYTMNFKTSSLGRARLVFLSQAGGAIAAPYKVTGSSGGSAGEQAIVAYVTGTGTAICGHDGSFIMPPANVTTTINRRLRRSYRLS